MAMNKFVVVEGNQYYRIDFGSLHILRIPKRVGKTHNLYGVHVTDKQMAKSLCKIMNENKEALIGKSKSSSGP